MALENDKYNTHPYIRSKEKLKEDGLMVFDNVTTIPVYKDALLTGDMLVVVCHGGVAWGEEGAIEKNDVAVMLPYQIMRCDYSSEDFLHTVVAMSEGFFEKLKHMYPYTRYTSYNNKHIIHLTDGQYEFVNNALDVLRVIARQPGRHRTEMLLQQISILLNMFGEFRKANNPEDVILEPHMKLFSRFYESIIQHYAESHGVAFYAKMFDLTPKYFSAIIKKETGASAIKWISEYVTIQAKQLLDIHKEYTVLQVSREIGFSDQATFSRYFKKYTGMTPREYRDSKKPNKN